MFPRVQAGSGCAAERESGLFSEDLRWVLKDTEPTPQREACRSRGHERELGFLRHVLMQFNVQYRLTKVTADLILR